MARRQVSGDEPAASGPDPALLARAAVDWLAPVRAQLAGALSAGRMPHALLLLGRAGAGQSELAWWLAQLLLCDRASAGPCNDCPACQLFRAGTHPDLHRLGIEDDATVIRVEQVRELSQALVLRSYRGRRKAAVIDPAEAMNLNAANALLKTLEEPPADTVLILASSRPDRLPRTVQSRCSRVTLPQPAQQSSLSWLDRQEPREDWPRLLALAGGAPFLALEQASAGLAELDREMDAALDAAAGGSLDLVGTAAAWSKDRPAERLAWLENWLMGRLKEALQPSDLVNNNRVPSLHGPGPAPIMGTGYRLLDSLREARLLTGGSLNAQLLFEGLLIPLAEFAGRSRATTEDTAG